MSVWRKESNIPLASSNSLGDAGPVEWVTAFTNDKLFEIYDHENELEDEQQHVLTIVAPLFAKD